MVNTRMKSLIDKIFGCNLKQTDPILNKDKENLRQKRVFWEGKC